jgi:hypothetical protein
MRRKDVSIASLFDAESTIAAANNAGAEIMLRSDDIYPERLAQTARPPLLLYYKGDASRLDDRLVGIVGARNASLAARPFAEEIAADLSTAGIGIVSGLARGIDAAPIGAQCKDFRLALWLAALMPCTRQSMPPYKPASRRKASFLPNLRLGPNQPSATSPAETGLSPGSAWPLPLLRQLSAPGL